MIFRPTSIKIPSQQKIEIVFSASPSLFLSKANFSIISTFSGVSDLSILSINIDGNTITLNTQPQFANNLYLITLLDLPTQPFESNDGIELLSDQTSRQIYFIGVEDINIVRDQMLNNLPSNYDTGSQTIVHDIISTIANDINTTSVTLREIKNNSFISVPVNDELYFRGTSPTDRLNNEGVFQVSRVAKTITGTNAAGSKTFDPITDPNLLFEIINLRATQIKEVIPNPTTLSSFDGFLITTGHNFVIKLLSLSLNSGSFEYDPKQFGYALLNNNYDRLARPASFLKNNQILLSSLTHGMFPEPVHGDTIEAIYEFDNIGRRIDKNSIELFSLLEQKNEKVPANITSFFLNHSNIVSNTGAPIFIDGVIFNISTINLNKHSAFLREIAFNADSLPYLPGDYAINYSTGQVFVVGTITQPGTGTTPPVATYFFKDVALSNTDFFINDDGYNLSINPFSHFALQPFTIAFLYEDVFTQDIDYIVSSHIEVLHERIANRLISDFGIETLYGPVKDVHQILNETTGESYTPGLTTNNQIFFTGNTPPKTSTTINELAQFGFVNNEDMEVGIPSTTPNGLLRLFPIKLRHHPIINQRMDGIAANFNTSAQFTKSDLFINEFYFNSFETIQLNIEKLHNIGDFLIDYNNGQIYLAVSSSQSFDVGQISYIYGTLIPNSSHVLSVSSIGLGPNPSKIIKDFDVNLIEDGIIVPKNLNISYDFFDETRLTNFDNIFIAQLQDDFTLYTKSPIRNIFGVFTQNAVDNLNTTSLISANVFNGLTNSFIDNRIDLKSYVVLQVAADVDTNYFHVIIPDDTTVVKSIVVIDTNTELLDTQLYVIKLNNIIIKSVVPSPLVNPTTATVIIQNPIVLDSGDVLAGLDSLVDIFGRRFVITSIIGGTTLVVNVDNFTPPITNVGSQILDSNGILVAEHLVITSVTELPNLLFVLHYDMLPNGILAGYKVKDSNGNVFTITDVQSASVVISATDTIPVVDSTAKIETLSLLISIGPQQTKLMLPKDAPISIGTNVRIGYVPTTINNLILAGSSTNSAGGTAMVIDYSIGQFFLTYTHLDDELVISYDWGDNQLDWSISTVLQQGDPYFVSYKFGASRDGLETNFGPLTNVDFLQHAPLSISRETYRAAVSGSIKAFLKGPTHEAIRLLVHAFTQIDPDIEESILKQWVIGRDPLMLQDPQIINNVKFGNGKFNEGLVVDGSNSIVLPGESSMRLEQGTFSAWIRPNWYGNQADEFININLPTKSKSVFYNAHNVLPQDVELDPWYLVINSDAYGSAFVFNNYIEIHNSKNEPLLVESPISDGYNVDNDGYSYSSTNNLHKGLIGFPFVDRIGTYLWERKEKTLSVVNNITINFTGQVNALNYIDPSRNIIDVLTVSVNDGYALYSTGFYLSKQNKYDAEIILEDVHLSISPPFPHFNPPIFVSILAGSFVATIISGSSDTLSVGQQISIPDAFPMPVNIIGISSSNLVFRFPAMASVNNVEISPLDPLSNEGTQDGYGEIHLIDKLGHRIPNSLQDRINGWERQLLVQMSFSPSVPEHIMIINTSDPPLSTQTSLIDSLSNLVAGLDVMVDGYGNAFEIDHIQAPYVWLQKPAASGAELPFGSLTAFRKMGGIKNPDQTLSAQALNWSFNTSFSFSKNSAQLSFVSSLLDINSSYITHLANNSDGYAAIRFGQSDLSVDSVARVERIDYTLYPIFDLKDTFIGNTGKNAVSDTISFKYDLFSTGIPAIGANKYVSVFTSKMSANSDEPTDQVFIKLKIPSIWAISDDNGSLDFLLTPVVSFSLISDGDIINIVDGYGMNYSVNNGIINLTAIDTSTYTPGHSSILLDGGPELRIAYGKRHFIFDAPTNEGSLQLYRSGDGFLTAQVNINDPMILNIRSNISSWLAGEFHHVAMSWKINSPDGIDELHLFVDGDEVPNEITIDSQLQDGYIGQIYEELLTPIIRVASSGGFIVNDINGSGVFIPSSAIVQPDSTWVNRTIVLNSISLGAGLFLNAPLIIGSIVSVIGGTMLFLSFDGTLIDFAPYGPSTPILYGLATYITAQSTSLIRSNFAIFKNNIEINGPFGPSPQFRQVGTTQIVELFDINASTGEYIENVILGDIIAIRTYGLLSQTTNKTIYQYGSLIRALPVVIDDTINGQLESTDVVINNGDTAFITDLEKPIDPTQVVVTKILLPRIFI